MSLLDDLRKIGLSPTDVPNQGEVQGVLGAIVKTLEHAGVTVAEDLLPTPVEEVVAAAAPVVGNEALAALHDLVTRAETALQGLENKPAAADAPSAAAAPSVDHPATEPVPSSSTSSSEPAPPESSSTTGSPSPPAGPDLPPIEGAS